MTDSSLRVKIITAFASVYLIWGSTYLAIRFVIETMPPFLMAGFRFLLAGGILLLFEKFRSKEPEKITKDHIRSGFIVGGLLLLGGNGGVVWAEQFVPSGLTALLISTVPIWIVVFTMFTGSKSKPDKLTVIGVVTGFAGLLYLVYNTTGFSADSINPFGVLALIFATISWAYGSVITSRLSFPKAKLTAVALQMLGGGVLLTLFSLITGDAFLFNPETVSLKSFLSLIYLILFGSLIGYTAYIWLLEKAGPPKTATYAYVNPVVAIFLGWLLADEVISFEILTGAAIILVSVAMIISVKARKA
ncbi:MAG: EamA family transporter [Ignavibacteriales bacterium]|nr:MAG: EamA family transporter [Ignavibacteriales bacterium]